MTEITMWALATVLVRQLLILAAIARSGRFLATPQPWPRNADVGNPTFFLVVPVLRETTLIAETIEHLEALAREHVAQLVVVTTQRERAEAAYPGQRGTIDLVEELASAGKFIH